MAELDVVGVERELGIWSFDDTLVFIDV